MVTVALDVHSGLTQLAAVSQDGEVLLELQVETRPEELRRVASGIRGPKRVVFEEGPLSGMINDALKGVAQEIIAADPTMNALIAGAEDSTDEKDALRLATLARAGSVHPVYVPEEPGASAPDVGPALTRRAVQDAPEPGAVRPRDVARGRRRQKPRKSAMPQECYTLQGTRGLPLRRAARGEGDAPERLARS